MEVGISDTGAVVIFAGVEEMLGGRSFDLKKEDIRKTGFFFEIVPETCKPSFRASAWNGEQGY